MLTLPPFPVCKQVRADNWQLDCSFAPALSVFICSAGWRGSWIRSYPLSPPHSGKISHVLQCSDIALALLTLGADCSIPVLGQPANEKKRRRGVWVRWRSLASITASGIHAKKSTINHSYCELETKQHKGKLHSSRHERRLDALDYVFNVMEGIEISRVLEFKAEPIFFFVYGLTFTKHCWFS